MGLSSLCDGSDAALADAMFALHSSLYRAARQQDVLRDWRVRHYRTAPPGFQASPLYPRKIGAHRAVKGCASRHDGVRNECSAADWLRRAVLLRPHGGEGGEDPQAE